MVAPMTVLRLEIDMDWTSNEFSRLFEEISFLHLAAQFGFVGIDGQADRYFFPRPSQRLRDAWDTWLDVESEIAAADFFNEIAAMNYMRFYVRNPSVLSVKAIKFGSSGFTDFFGVAGVIRETGKFILGVTDRLLAIDDRALAREDRRQVILQKKLANADRLLKLSDKANMDPEAKRALLKRVLEADNYLETKILDGQITDATERDE